MKNIFYKFAIKAGICSRNQGFVMPIVAGFGLVMLLVTVTIMVRSQIDRQNNEAQQTKAKSRSIADAAVAQVLNILNDNRNLALVSGSANGTTACDPKFTTKINSPVCWNSLDPTNNSSLIPIQNYSKVCKNGVWVDQRNAAKKLLSEQAIDSSNPAKGKYKLNSYTYAVEWEDDPTIAGDGTPSPNPRLGDGAEIHIPGARIKSITGTLDISANVNYAPSNSPTAQQTRLKDLQGSPIRIQLDIPVKPAEPSDEIPGLWIKQGDMTNSNATGNNKNLVASQVWLRDCSAGDSALTQIATNVSAGKLPGALPANEPTVSITKPYVKFTPVDIPAIDKTFKTLTFPNNTTYTSATITGLFTAAGGNIATPNQFVNIGTRVLNAQNPRLFDINIPLSGTGTGGTCDQRPEARTLPRLDDTFLPTDLDGNGVVDGISFSDYVVSSLQGQTVTITPGCKVRLYILGNIDSTSKIIHNCPAIFNNPNGCSPSDVQIYGLGISNNSFCFNDPNGTNNVLDAFIFAPDYQVGIISSVVRGALWIKNWGKIVGCSSATQITSAMVIQKTIKWNALPSDLISGLIPQGLPPKIGVKDSGKAISWKVCQTDSLKRCNGSEY